MKTLNITVLYNESIPSRIYLALLLNSGYKPKKIINVKVTPKGGKYKQLERYAGSFIARKILHFSRYIRAVINDNPIQELHRKFLQHFGINEFDLKRRISKYTDDYEELFVHSFDDDVLVRKLKGGAGQQTFLFTGGGILKEKVLGIDNVKMLHIHPGIVPDVKGADGFFWSYLLRGKPGYSIFYMNPGIDTGDIVYREEFTFLGSDFGLESTNNDKIYRAILDVYDPALRISAFINMLNSLESNDLYNIDSEVQDPNEGRVYFFLHQALKDHIINSFKVN